MAAAMLTRRDIDALKETYQHQETLARTRQSQRSGCM